MKISEAIKELERLKILEGDIDVAFHDIEFDEAVSVNKIQIVNSTDGEKVACFNFVFDR